jgi:ABC-2 type transport system ATP-binding protein
MAETMIEVVDLKKRYGEVTALGGVTFQVPRGQVVGLLGPNGAGKTTCMRVITGYVAPSEGRALVAGHDVLEEPEKAQQRIGYLPEGNPLYGELRVEEALRFAARMRGIPASDRARAISRSVEAAGLKGVERRTIGTFSKGYRQRVGLAQALLHEPDLLILDEPTSGLDPNQQEDIRTLIRQLGQERTVMLSTHILSEVEAVCHRAIIVNRGLTVADGSVEEIKQRAAGDAAIVVVLRADPEATERAFGGLPFVRSVVCDDVPDEAGVVQARLVVEGGERRQQLETVAATAARAGLALSEIRPETASLERIFAELTGRAAEEVQA